MADTELISVRVSRETARRLERLAESVDRSKSYLASEAIEEFLSLQEWQVEAIHEGIAEADAGKLHGHEEARRRLAKWKGVGKRRGA